MTPATSLRRTSHWRDRLLPFLLGLVGCGALIVWLRDDEPPVPRVRALAASTAEPPTLTAAARTGHEPDPITEQDLTNERQADLLYGAWRAIKQGDYRTGKQLVAAHRVEYPGQWEDVNDGLEVLADCMEEPSETTVSAARRFYDERAESMMRKRIRRHCLEPFAAAQR